MTVETEVAIPGKSETTVWLVGWIARELEMPADQLDASRSLMDYGLSSVAATMLVGDLEDWLGLRLSPTLAWDYPSIDEMADHLQECLAADAGKQPESEAAVDGDASALLANLDKLSDDEVEALLTRLSAAQRS